MNEEQCKEMKKTTIAELQQPIQFEGYVIQYTLKKQKKRYLIWKGNMMYIFNKYHLKEMAKDIFKIPFGCAFSIETVVKDKCDVIKFKTNPNELILILDESSCILHTTFQKYTTDIRYLQHKEDECESKEQTLTSEEINELLEQHQGKWSNKEITDFFREIGKETLEKYKYTLLIRMISDWTNEEFIDCVYKDFCEEDLDDMSAFLGGKDDPTSEVIFVFGRDIVGAHRITDIYLKIYQKFNLVWSELARCLLSALACWELTSKDMFFCLILLDMFKTFDVAEIVTFLQFYATYEEEINEVVWSTLPDHIIDLFKKIVEGWDNKRILEMCEMIQAMWQWNSDEITSLKKVLLSNSFN
ncbi:PH domain-containing protein [Entamoeba marina]